MTVDLGERTGGQTVVWGQLSDGMVDSSVLDMPPDPWANYGIDELQHGVSVNTVGDGWYVYGTPVAGSRLEIGAPNPAVTGDLPSDRMLDYFEATPPTISMQAATFAARAVQDLARNPEGGNVQLFYTSMFDWDHDPATQAFVEQFHHLVSVGQVIRDDTAVAEDPLARFGTRIHVAYEGKLPVVLIERTDCTDDQYGRPVLVRTVEAVKTYDHTTMVDLVNQLSLPETWRVHGLLDSLGASDVQRQYVLGRVTRAAGRRGSGVLSDRDIRRWVEEGDREPRRTAMQAGRALLKRLVDSRWLHRMARQAPPPQGA